MFVVSSSRTMANAKFKSVDDGVVRIDALAQRNHRIEAAKRAEREREIERLAILSRQRRIANEGIQAANEALRRLHRTWQAEELFRTASLPIMNIVRRISKATGISVDEIFSVRKSNPIVLARQAVFYWCRRRTNKSWPEIGKRLGGRDHTTALWGANAYRKKRKAMGRNLREVR